MKDDRLYLDHTRDAIDDIEEYVLLGRDVFMSDRMWQDAVIRKIEILGEAAKSSHLCSKRGRDPGLPAQ